MGRGYVLAQYSNSGIGPPIARLSSQLLLNSDSAVLQVPSKWTHHHIFRVTWFLLITLSIVTYVTKTASCLHVVVGLDCSQGSRLCCTRPRHSAWSRWAKDQGLLLLLACWSKETRLLCMLDQRHCWSFLSMVKVCHFIASTLTAVRLMLTWVDNITWQYILSRMIWK